MKTIPYDKTLHGAFNYPEGFAEMLAGRSIEEQLDCFRMGNGLYRKDPVSERRKRGWDYSNRLEKEEAVESLLIDGDKIAGVMVRDCHGKTVPCLPEQGYLIRDDSEPDGSGYKEFRLYTYLICVSKEFDEEINL